MKRSLVLALVLVTTAGVGPAWAQPDDEDDEDVVDDDGVEVDEETPPGLPEPPPPPEPEPEPETAAPSRRPDGLSYAIGFGWAIPSDDLWAPDVTTVRLRLPSGLTFEPMLELSRGSTTEDDGTNAVTTTNTTLALSTLVRYPFRVNERVDFSLVGALGLSQTSTDREAMLPDSSTTRISLAWGIALDYWIKRHWAISMTALNPFASLDKTSMDNAGIESSTSTNFIGIVFDPSVYITVHLYF